MKRISLAIVSLGCIITLNADVASDLITAKEVWGTEYGVGPSSVDDDDYDYDDDDNKSDWPNSNKPKVDESTGPSLLVPKAEKEVFEPGKGQ